MLTPDQLAELRAYVDVAAANNGITPGTALAMQLLAHIDAQAAELVKERETQNRVAAEIRGELGSRIATLERDAARYRWLTQEAYIGECFTDRGVVLEIRGTDREIPVFHERATDREEVDAAIDAAMPPRACTCPSGDGSLRWPCPQHPPELP
ncbi:hypothetical protein [Chromobacterium phragmitis]|uniref:Uncharacterized protein n=1 Tax=Chromobacterium phragmitis TaxID=2202141 RepID=A0A344UPG2_9NEIS|nr:hypothetical protein [Chromobacterium phragmitis]AXE37160.1 hypothetical protein DK843_22690 [Chromobacterium phragmitis]